MLQDIFVLFAKRPEFFLEQILQHLQISGISILLATAIGLFLGIFISEHKKTSGFVIGLTSVIYTIPSIAMLGFLIPFSGIGDTTAIIALTIYALLPMVRGTYTGITSIDPAVIEAARGMGSTDFQILYRIKMPLAMPVIISALRNMVVMTIALTGIAAFIGAGGLGVAIYRGITTNNTAMTIAGSILVAVLALLLDFAIGRIEKHLLIKWKLQPQNKKRMERK
ncbi:ABC transporter permease [Christensenellaceae bacterium OttesenSCG-928-K19]|nr:ABC transporter permease [Christensenellaceae bacterium OttesenSCG-928-K19]